jgi:hypothetical protein
MPPKNGGYSAIFVIMRKANEPTMYKVPVLTEYLGFHEMLIVKHDVPTQIRPLPRKPFLH